MSSKAIQIASAIIAQSSRDNPADRALREKLKGAKGISRAEGREISLAVFAYYRWLGWLDAQEPIEKRMQRARELNQRFQKDPKYFPDTELPRAVPEWAQAELAVTTEWLRGLQLEPNLWLRARPGKGRALAEKLGECWVRGDGALRDTLCYEGAEDLFRTPEFHAGEFEVQDISSQLVGLACAPQPGETWWDACAGEGGKLLQICDLMRNKGLVWASDRAEWRLQKLKWRAARAKAFNYRAVSWDGGAKLPTKTKFDGILVDAPCSGTGTWQRNPHARWTTTAEDVRELSEVQKRLVANAAAALKPGGRLIYSVCTLTKAETEDVARHISERFPELKPMSLPNPLNPKEPPVEALWFWPQTVEGNGMFICGWRKEAPKPEKASKSKDGAAV